LSVTVRLPVRVPIEVGVNVTLMVQLAPPITEAPQVLVSAKSPVAVMLEMFKLALPASSSITVRAALIVASAWLVKARLAGTRLAPGRFAALIFATNAFETAPPITGWKAFAVGNWVEVVVPVT
jgi:hypothetical protein